MQRTANSHDLSHYVRLVWFGLMNVAAESDAMLVRRKLWRNHHRVLDSLSRGVARSLSELAERNGTSKQALHKSIQGLLRAKLVQVEVDPLHRRAKSVKLTPAGRKLEAALDQCQERVLGAVYAKVGAEKMEIWAEVMAEIAAAPIDMRAPSAKVRTPTPPEEAAAA